MLGMGKFVEFFRAGVEDWQVKLSNVQVTISVPRLFRFSRVFGWAVGPRRVAAAEAGGAASRRPHDRRRPGDAPAGGAASRRPHDRRRPGDAPAGKPVAWRAGRRREAVRGRLPPRDADGGAAARVASRDADGGAARVASRAEGGEAYAAAYAKTMKNGHRCAW